MTKHITLKLTANEAMALRMAAGNVMDYHDAFESVFTTGPEKQVANRAWKKLMTAIHGRPRQ